MRIFFSKQTITISRKDSSSGFCIVLKPQEKAYGRISYFDVKYVGFNTSIAFQGQGKHWILQVGSSMVRVPLSFNSAQFNEIHS